VVARDLFNPEEGTETVGLDSVAREVLEVNKAKEDLAEVNNTNKAVKEVLEDKMEATAVRVREGFPVETSVNNTNKGVSKDFREEMEATLVKTKVSLEETGEVLVNKVLEDKAAATQVKTKVVLPEEMVAKGVSEEEMEVSAVDSAAADRPAGTAKNNQ